MSWNWRFFQCTSTWLNLPNPMDAFGSLHQKSLPSKVALGEGYSEDSEWWPTSLETKKGDHTVDGRNPKQPPAMYKTFKNHGDKLPTSTGDCPISSINSMKPCLQTWVGVYDITTRVQFMILQFFSRLRAVMEFATEEQ